MDKQTVWIFGDSFSTTFSASNVDIWQIEYIKWKGYVPKCFSDILGDELGCSLKHFAFGGICNDTIFELIYTQAPNIKKNDIVIIGWTSPYRFRLSMLENKWWDIVPNSAQSYGDMKPPISQRTIDEIAINRDSYTYINELHSRMNFINWLFSENKLIHWTPFYYEKNKIYGFSGINTIYMETNNELMDGHYSELGHKFLASKFIELLNNDVLRNHMNTLYSNLI